MGRNFCDLDGVRGRFLSWNTNTKSTIKEKKSDKLDLLEKHQKENKKTRHRQEENTCKSYM